MSKCLSLACILVKQSWLKLGSNHLNSNKPWKLKRSLQIQSSNHGSLAKCIKKEQWINLSWPGLPRSSSPCRRRSMPSERPPPPFPRRLPPLCHRAAEGLDPRPPRTQPDFRRNRGRSSGRAASLPPQDARRRPTISRPHRRNYWIHPGIRGRDG